MQNELKELSGLVSALEAAEQRRFVSLTAKVEKPNTPPMGVVDLIRKRTVGRIRPLSPLRAL